MLIHILSELHTCKDRAYTLKVDEPSALGVDVEEDALCIIAVGLAVLLFLRFNLPDLSQEDAPEYHVLHKRLLVEEIPKLLIMLQILGRPCQDLQAVVTIVRKEGLAKV